MIRDSQLWANGRLIGAKAIQDTNLNILFVVIYINRYYYNMPTRHHLMKDQNNRFILNYTFDHDFNEIIAENYTLTVILPEGSTKIKVHLPFEVDSIEESLSFSTLDYIGRPKISIRKSNVISKLHKVPFQVSHTLLIIILGFLRILKQLHVH